MSLQHAGARHAPPSTGFALWALGFRPMYLLASAYAALAIPLWALQFAGILPGARAPAWHAHEMVFGFTLAVIVGFLFTAGRNWSGQPTPTGPSLAVLAAVWLAGRALIYSPWPWAMLVVGAAFPLLAAAALLKALHAGGNRRNYFFGAVLVALAMAQALMQASLAGWIDVSPTFALQLGLDAVLFVMAVMGGRVIPMFSNNGAPGTDASRQPVLERAALASVLAVAAADAAGLHGPIAVALLLIAACTHTARLVLWNPWRTWRAPLVWVLHAAYAWIPLHLALRAASAAGWLAPTLAAHALTAGAIGTLTLGMMTRTARGHLGRPLKAGRAEVAMYALVLAGATLRVAGPLLWPAGTLAVIAASAFLWAGGFGLYAVRYGPWLCRARIDGWPG